jgi:hypothetical protein
MVICTTYCNNPLCCIKKKQDIAVIFSTVAYCSLFFFTGWVPMHFLGSSNYFVYSACKHNAYWNFYMYRDIYQYNIYYKKIYFLNMNLIKYYSLTLYKHKSTQKLSLLKYWLKFQIFLYPREDFNNNWYESPMQCTNSRDVIRPEGTGYNSLRFFSMFSLTMQTSIRTRRTPPRCCAHYSLLSLWIRVFFFQVSHKVSCVFCFPQHATVLFLIYSQVQQKKVSDVWWHYPHTNIHTRKGRNIEYHNLPRPRVIILLQTQGSYTKI